MITTRSYEEADFEQVVQMYYTMCLETYPHRQFKSIQHFYKNVLMWTINNYDIIIAEDSGVITGFSMCYVDNMGGIVDNYYQAECIFVKAEYRKTRSAYLLYHACIDEADEHNYIIATDACNLTESSSISSKLGIKLFTKYERIQNG